MTSQFSLPFTPHYCCLEALWNLKRFVFVPLQKTSIQVVKFERKHIIEFESKNKYNKERRGRRRQIFQVVRFQFHRAAMLCCVLFPPWPGVNEPEIMYFIRCIFDWHQNLEMKKPFGRGKRKKGRGLSSYLSRRVRRWQLERVFGERELNAIKSHKRMVIERVERERELERELPDNSRAYLDFIPHIRSHLNFFRIINNVIIKRPITKSEERGLIIVEWRLMMLARLHNAR